MRAGAEWIASKQGLENSDVSWIGIGFSTADGGAALIIALWAMTTKPTRLAHGPRALSPTGDAW